MGVGWTCCYLIYACERVRDYDRAAQCRNVEEFAERMRIQFLNGVCRSTTLPCSRGTAAGRGRRGAVEGDR